MRILEQRRVKVGHAAVREDSGVEHDLGGVAGREECGGDLEIV